VARRSTAFGSMICRIEGDSTPRLVCWMAPAGLHVRLEAIVRRGCAALTVERQTATVGSFRGTRASDVERATRPRMVDQRSVRTEDGGVVAACFRRTAMRE